MFKWSIENNVYHFLGVEYIVFFSLIISITEVFYWHFNLYVNLLLKTCYPSHHLFSGDYFFLLLILLKFVLNIGGCISYILLHLIIWYFCFLFIKSQFSDIYNVISNFLLLILYRITWLSFCLLSIHLDVNVFLGSILLRCINFI